MPWYEIFTSQFESWLSKPLPSILALIIGAYVGYLISRLRHEGKIDMLEERIKHKDEQIKVKDDAIQSLNTEPAKPEDRGRARTTDSALAAEITAPTAVPTPSTEEIGARILSAVNFTTYKFVFNPETDQSKILTFHPNGAIAQGQNDNENRWRVVNGRLEILDGRGALYSRFSLMEDGLSFHHTNEPDTRSIRGQFMIPIAVRPASMTVHG
jgi:hypothetical protein